ncbi:hypothetical protein CR513_04478, partial [Mucuna pruriens]
MACFGGLTPLYLAISGGTLQLCHNDRCGRPSSPFHKFGRLIILNLECLSLNVSGLTVTSVQTNELGCTLVDLDKVGYKGESFIMAYHAKQVFYVNDPSNKGWETILQRKSMHGSDENQDVNLNLTNTPSFSNHINKVDDVHTTRHDHIEGLWEDIAI